MNDLTARTTSRATVDYDTFVLRYAARQRGHILLSTTGIVAAVGAATWLTGAWLVLGAAIGIGMLMAGFAGFAVASDAHRTYTRHLAIAVSETYAQRPEPGPATVRPFVASSNGNGQTTNTGRLSFTPEVWQSLFDLALSNGGIVDRDNVCKRASIGRRWYHSDPNSPDGFRAFQAELRQLGFIDPRNRLTPAALAWYQSQIALPLAALPVRPAYDRPTADRNGMTAVIAGVGEAD